jgi:hypothetical protein
LKKLNVGSRALHKFVFCVIFTRDLINLKGMDGDFEFPQILLKV